MEMMRECRKNSVVYYSLKKENKVEFRIIMINLDIPWTLLSYHLFESSSFSPPLLFTFFTSLSLYLFQLPFSLLFSPPLFFTFFTSPPLYLSRLFFSLPFSPPLFFTFFTSTSLWQKRGWEIIMPPLNSNPTSPSSQLAFYTALLYHSH